MGLMMVELPKRKEQFWSNDFEELLMSDDGQPLTD